VRPPFGDDAPRLLGVFNIQGSELVFLLLVALIVLGPEKLPDAVRRFGRGYAEFKKMANGFQGELRQVLDEPMRELRDTADAVREAAKFEITPDAEPPNGASGDLMTTTKISGGTPQAQPPREPGLNFGSANPRPRVDPVNAAEQASGAAPETPQAPTAEDVAE